MFLMTNHATRTQGANQYQYPDDNNDDDDHDDETNSNVADGGTDFYNDGDAADDKNQDGGGGTDFYHPPQNDYHTDEDAANAAAADEEFVVKLNLRRLLYRMERFENFEGSTTEDDEGDTINSSSAGQTASNKHHQLLSRAQYCQTLWEQVAAHNVEDTDDARKVEYRELSMRVDTVCRRALILAEATKEQQHQQLIAVTEQRDMEAVVQSLFFSNRNDDDDDSTSQNEDFAAEEEFAAVGEDSDDEEDESDDDNDEIEEEELSPRRSRNKNKVGGDNKALQESQRETMETAIALMAQQMKQATLGISETLQQQTTSTLDELEDVAEQNVVEVSKVADNVQHHNKKQSKTNFGNYIQLISILGLFVFVLVTIFTIPKSSVNVFYKPNGQPTIPVRLVQKVSSEIQRAVIVVQHSIMVPSGVRVATDTTTQDDEDEDEERDELVLQQQQKQQREQERLNDIVQHRNQHDQHRRSTTEENKNPTEKIQTAPGTVNVETIMASLKEYQERVEHELLVTDDGGRGGRGSGRVVEGIQQEEADTRRIMETIENTIQQQQQQHSTESSIIGTKTSQYNEDTNIGRTTSEGANGDDTTFALKREGVASRRISPRDLRVAAGADDEQQLKRYVQRAPEHLNRQDKYGWTPLHYAVRAHRLHNIRFLLHYNYDGNDNNHNSYKCDPTIRSKEGQTAFDVAYERFGSEHPVTGIFFELGFEEKENTNENVHTSAVVEKLPPGWSIKWDPTHERNFYHNSVGPVSQWERPNKRQEQEAAAVHLKQQQQAEAEDRSVEQKRAERMTEKEQRTANEEQERSLREEKRRKLFPPIPAIMEDDDDIIDDALLEQKRKRLDALLGRGDEL